MPPDTQSAQELPYCKCEILQSEKVPCRIKFLEVHLIRLPGSDINQRLVFICHIDQKEQISRVGITGRAVFLTDINRKDLSVFEFLKPLNLIVGKTDINKLIICKNPCQICQI